MQNPLSPQQSLIYAMITISAVDGNLSYRELSRIGSIVRELPVFNDYDDEQLVPDSQACGSVLGKDNGLQNVLQMIKEGLPPRLFQTAYALSVEVAASDMEVKAEEIRFLDLLAARLNLDKLTCAALECGARARHQHG